MARIFVAFYNGLMEFNRIPIFYESFCDGMKKYGNEVMIEMHSKFGADLIDIPEEKKTNLINFNPDICFIFNNAYYDITFLDCPIIIMESDSPIYYSNKESIKKNSQRYTFVTSQTSSVKIIKETYGEKCKVYRIPFFTEILNKKEKQDINISFIGTRFDISEETKRYRSVVRGLSSKELPEYLKVLREIESNPFVNLNDLYLMGQFDEKIIERVDIGSIVCMLSGEKRIKLLSVLSDLGLKIYGTRNWITTYYYDLDLAGCYDYELVTSLRENELIYNRSKIGISVAHIQAKTGYAWRIMDIMASNAVLVSDYHADFLVDFGDIPFPIYNNRFEAREICKKLLDDSSMRKEIVGRCNELIETKFRFKNYLFELEEALDIKLE